MNRNNIHLGLALAGACMWLLAAPAVAQQPAPAPVPVTTSGLGIGLHVGTVDITFAGEINAFYVHDSPDSVTAAHVIDGGLASVGPKDSSSVRNGLLPGFFSINVKTVQDGYDVGATFGFYPGINNSTGGGKFGQNASGAANGLGTPGIDFRQQFITIGNAGMGTLKFGRDIGLFGQEAILNDFTLLGVGSTGGNTQPSNTSLGRIGLGYIYTDWIPQITYTSPSFAGLQGAIGIFTPLNAVNFSGDSGTLTQHEEPQLQGKLAYTVPTAGPVKAKLWANFVTQKLQSSGAVEPPAGGSVRGWGVDAGTKLTFGPADVVLYGYDGLGLGTTALFFDAVTPAGDARRSHGYYFQGTYTFFDKLTIGGSYGLSHLGTASGETTPTLVKDNSSYVAGVHYKWTKWFTLVGEYVHTKAKAQNGNSASSDTVAAGGILFF